MRRHGVDPEKFLDYVHAIDLSPVAPAPRLDAALARLEGRKLIFTNGSVAHAANVMGRLGVAHHFEDVFDIRAAGWVPKPEPATYDALVARHAIDARAAAMIDDLPRNLAPAAALGMTTVLVETGEDWSKPTGDRSHIHHTTGDLVAWLESAAASLTVRTAPAMVAPRGARRDA
jgi:putative hydrolase of the HAD superfamily